jgi:cold shock CspA family protein
MQLYEGAIKSWKGYRGFGFIQPNGGGNQLFIHLRDLKHPIYQPQQGGDVCYKVVADKDGKTRAYDAFIKGREISQLNKKRVSRKISHKNKKQDENIDQECCLYWLSR